MSSYDFINLYCFNIIFKAYVYTNIYIHNKVNNIYNRYFKRFAKACRSLEEVRQNKKSWLIYLEEQLLDFLLL